jgi:type II secretory pathway pseudopilin PulG
MPPPLKKTAGFSLVEVTLALGVAAICLVTMLGLLPASLKTQQSSIQQTTANQIISQISSFLRADVRLPPGQYTKACGDETDPNNPSCDWGLLHGRWRDAPTPYKLYFTNNADQIQTGSLNGPPPATAVFRATIIYQLPPSETTSLANITVTWPAQVDPSDPTTGVPAGSVIAFVAINR